jgi:hypothetical protein
MRRLALSRFLQMKREPILDTYTHRRVGSVAGCPFRGGNAHGGKILENEGDLERLAPLLAGAEIVVG